MRQWGLSINTILVSTKKVEDFANGLLEPSIVKEKNSLKTLKFFLN